MGWIKRLIKYLSLDKCGGLELLFAFYMILSGYGYGSIPFVLLVLVIMDIVALVFRKPQRGKGISKEQIALYVFIAYYLIHEITLKILVPGLTRSFINAAISAMVVLVSIVIIAPRLKISKLIGSLNIVAIISIGGMLYHFAQLLSGATIHPLTLPFLPKMSESSRAFEEVLRPTSFYWEPAAYASFMFFPLFISLYQKRYIWAIVIFLSMFLSTSTTGIAVSFMILLLYVFTQKVNVSLKIALVAVGIALGVALVKVSYFESAVEKIENTDVTTNVRMSQGLKIVANMPLSHILLGAPAANAYDYYKRGYLQNVDVALYDEAIYMPSFWLAILRLGIIGALMYVWLYARYCFKGRRLLPLVVPLILTMFTATGFLGGGMAFDLIFLEAFTEGTNRKNASISHRVRIGKSDA